MTRLPMESRDVEALRGDEWPEYQLNVVCAAPGCDQTTLERHHVWRKSFVGGDVWWVKLSDGSVTGNCIGLCNEHHGQLTRNEAHIAYERGTYGKVGFAWTDLFASTQWMQWQPPKQADLDLGIGHVLVEGHNANECPTCHRALPRPKLDTPQEEKRIRRTWSITVPKDNLENGADILDTLLEEIREEMGKRGMSYGAEAKYFVLSTALALFLTHVETIAAE